MSFTLPRDPRALGAKCDQCCMRNCGKAVLWSGSLESTVAVVGEGPGRNEVDAGIPFVGQSGQMLDRVLMEVGMPRSGVLVLNATAHFPPNGNLEDFIIIEKRKAKEEWKKAGNPEKTFNWTGDPIECCFPMVARILGIPICERCGKYATSYDKCMCKNPRLVYQGGRSKKPDVIVATGGMALYALYGVNGIMKWRGSPLVVKG